MRKLIIGAPFGNYITCPDATSTLGTYTLNPKSGRIWRSLLSVRYYWRIKSWVNKLGLPNPGIRTLKREDCINRILSIHGYSYDEWSKLIEFAIDLEPLSLELNLSCPNVTKVAIKEAVEAADLAHKLFGWRVIAKLAPIRWMDFVHPLVDVGIDWFHLCNTIDTPGGGISGKTLKQYSLWAVEEVRKTYDMTMIIGGGGVTCVQDAKDYLNAGANQVSVASMLFNPLNWYRLPSFVSELR
jgi:dihydroorotate dehydrogenase